MTDDGPARLSRNPAMPKLESESQTRIVWGRGHIGTAWGRAWTTGDAPRCEPDCATCAMLGIVPPGATYEERYPEPPNPVVRVSAVNDDGSLERAL